MHAAGTAARAPGGGREHCRQQSADPDQHCRNEFAEAPWKRLDSSPFRALAKTPIIYIMSSWVSGVVPRDATLRIRRPVPIVVSPLTVVHLGRVAGAAEFCQLGRSGPGSCGWLCPHGGSRSSMSWCAGYCRCTPERRQVLTGRRALEAAVVVLVRTAATLANTVEDNERLHHVHTRFPSPARLRMPDVPSHRACSRRGGGPGATTDWELATTVDAGRRLLQRQPAPRTRLRPDI